MTVRELDDVVAEQANFDMANLRPESAGLPFAVFISQRGGARRDVPIKLSRNGAIEHTEDASPALLPITNKPAE